MDAYNITSKYFLIGMLDYYLCKMQGFFIHNVDIDTECLHNLSLKGSDEV